MGFVTVWWSIPWSPGQHCVAVTKFIMSTLIFWGGDSQLYCHFSHAFSFVAYSFKLMNDFNHRNQQSKSVFQVQLVFIWRQRGQELLRIMRFESGCSGILISAWEPLSETWNYGRLSKNMKIAFIRNYPSTGTLAIMDYPCLGKRPTRPDCLPNERRQ